MHRHCPSVKQPAKHSYEHLLPPWYSWHEDQLDKAPLHPCTGDSYIARPLPAPGLQPWNCPETAVPPFLAVSSASSQPCLTSAWPYFQRHTSSASLASQASTGTITCFANAGPCTCSLIYPYVHDAPQSLLVLGRTMGS